MRRRSSLLARISRALVVPLLVAAAALVVAEPARAASLIPVAGFGTNPGNLTMHAYLPEGRPAKAPLVVALHGCGQDAAGYYKNSGWKELADRWKFSVVFPQSSSANAANACFNWFLPGDTTRGQGEPLSIKQMIDYAITNYGADADRVFVTGLSAGGGMSATMLATYPDVFAAGSVAAGLPYRCATSQLSAYTCMFQGVDRTPVQWGDLVRGAYPGYSGPRPKVAIWHGTADYIVVPMNATELRDQWTNVFGVSQTPTSTASLPASTTLERYGDDVVRVYRVAGMGHGLPVDPGTRVEQCGAAAAYFLDTICSAYHDALYFGLDRPGGDNPDLPDAPAELAVTGTTESSVALSWAVVPEVNGYHVYRDGARITSVPVTTASHTDGGLSAGTDYSYQVSAVNTVGEGSRSAPVSATTGGTTVPVCVTASNYAHVQDGRAYHSGGYVYARGSDQQMGLYNIFHTTALRQTGSDYWVIGC